MLVKCRSTKILIFILIALIAYIIFDRNFLEHMTLSDLSTVSKNGNFTKITDDDLRKISIQKGTIILWGSAIAPPGWALCNGDRVLSDGKTIQTPNLCGRFALMANQSGIGLGKSANLDEYVFSPAGTTGGEEQVKLTLEELTRHVHLTGGEMCSDMAGDSYDHFVRTKGRYKDMGEMWTGYTGGDKPHNNMPPYYPLSYIIKI